MNLTILACFKKSVETTCFENDFFHITQNKFKLCFEIVYFI